MMVLSSLRVSGNFDLDAFVPVEQGRRFLKPLIRTEIFCATLILLFALIFLRPHLPAPFDTYTAEVRRSGLLGSSLAALSLTIAGLTITTMLVWARSRENGTGSSLISYIAGWPQALLILLFAAFAGAALYRFLPQQSSADARHAYVSGGVSIAIAFPLLICERFFDAIPRSQLPEALDLKALLFLSVLTFFGQGLAEIAAGLQFEGAYWAATVIHSILIAAALELGIRSMAIWFLPPVDPDVARAAIASVVAKSLRPGSLSPATLGRTIKSRFGMDFSRSWALAYVRDAFAPVMIGLILFTWFLSGVVSIGTDARGSYEKFGAPAEILKPGLHLILPWPFGQVRHVEYGAVHSLSIVDPIAAVNPQIEHAADVSRVEDIPPPSANRLWDQEQDSDNFYIIASNSTGRESFEIASVSLQIVYRIGMDDESARQATYHAFDPRGLVETASGRLLAQFFASKTLPDLMLENRQALALSLRAKLQEALNRLASGVEILSVVVQSLRPPSGAAAAYHDVQAGAIVAATNIAGERGRAETTLGLARQDAAELTKKSQAHAAELESNATVELAHFRADASSYKEAGRALLLERYLANLQASLGQSLSPGESSLAESSSGHASPGQPSMGQSSLEIIDHRLASPNAPVLDLRPALGPADNLTGAERQTP